MVGFTCPTKLFQKIFIKKIALMVVKSNNFRIRHLLVTNDFIVELQYTKNFRNKYSELHLKKHKIKLKKKCQRHAVFPSGHPSKY